MATLIVGLLFLGAIEFVLILQGNSFVEFIVINLLILSTILLFTYSGVEYTKEETYKKALKYNPYEYGYIYITKDSNKVVIDTIIVKKDEEIRTTKD